MRGLELVLNDEHIYITSSKGLSSPLVEKGIAEIIRDYLYIEGPKWDNKTGKVLNSFPVEITIGENNE